MTRLHKRLEDFADEMIDGSSRPTAGASVASPAASPARPPRRRARSRS